MDLSKHLKTKFITGLLLLIPLIITIYVVYLIISSIEAMVSPAIRNILSQIIGHEVYIPGTGFIVFIIIVYITGVVASNYFGKTLLAYGETFLKKIPFINVIYGSVKDMTDAFSSEKVKSFREVVLIEFPFQGRYAIGFVTKRIQLEGMSLCSVFVPTTPNPTSGYLIMAKAEELIFLDMNTDDALKYIISLGTSRTELQWKEKKSFLY
ncbi:MAG TPA: DUF502 domain-containing protein [Syntrophorhabdaceae bacterium]|nr:DUF502 domain-containing protein [Syntrophorhabdaceae bacterium]HQM80192.1 DUF502 domain-containing protein [Syntrophorhabdaceae bacterium]